MAPISIRLDRISKRFDHTVKGEVYAVRDVDLSVAEGELLTLLGPSGCGKSTTLRMIAGFEEPDDGTISIDGRDVTHVLPNKRGIGFVFQNYALFPHLSIFENVAYGLKVQGKAEAEIVRAVAEVLELVGLAKYERQQPHQLSGGEQQRVALARAVVFQPKVLLFDEPLSNLDAKLRVEMREQIRALQKRIGITTVYVTHDQEEAMAISDRIAVMERGQIVQDGTAQDLYYRPATEFVARFIGRTNLLPGRVAAGGDVEVEGLRVTLGSKLAAGSAVRLVVRPEMIDMAAGRAGEPGVGRILQRTFLGEKTDYEILLGGTKLQACRSDAFRMGTFNVGDDVKVSVDPANIHLLAQEESMIAMNRYVAVGVGALLAVSAVPASAQGTVNVYCSVQVEWCTLAANEFQKATGIKVSMTQKGSGETIAQLKAEAQNPKGDVWFGGTGDPHLQAAEENLTEPYKSAKLAELHPWAVKQNADSGGKTVGIYAGALGYGFNTELLAKKKAAPPACWADLLKPEFKGEIQMANPNSSGTAYVAIATLVQLMGEDKAFDYLKKLHGNINAYTRSGTAPMKAVARGETSVSISFVHDGVTEALAGFPVKTATPCEGTGYEIGSMSIVKGARNMANAKKFYDWALTPEAQKLGAQAKQFQVPSNKATPVPPEAPKFADMKLIDYDQAKYGKSAERKRLIARWDNEVGNLPKP